MTPKPTWVDRRIDLLLSAPHDLGRSAPRAAATLVHEGEEKPAHISEVWRSDTTSEQGVDLVDLDDCLAELEEMEPETTAEDEAIEELRGSKY